jgi:hypothetical protein
MTSYYELFLTIPIYKDCFVQHIHTANNNTLGITNHIYYKYRIPRKSKYIYNVMCNEHKARILLYAEFIKIIYNFQWFILINTTQHYNITSDADIFKSSEGVLLYNRIRPLLTLKYIIYNDYKLNHKVINKNTRNIYNEYNIRSNNRLHNILYKYNMPLVIHYIILSYLHNII